MDHARIDARSLAFGELIAKRLLGDPALVLQARANLDRWTITCSPNTKPALDEWRQALQEPVEQIAALLTATDERATRLRQSNPFAGVLSDQERNGILRRFSQHDPSPT